MPDFSITLAAWLAWATLALVALMVLGLLVLRWVRWRNAPRMAAFEARWRPVVMGCALGDALPDPLPTLAARERWPFMQLWLHAQMSVHGPSRQPLADLGMAMGCREMALARVDSSHYSERMVGLLALGFLRDAASVAWLQGRLVQGHNHTVIYAGRALLEIDEARHAQAVVQALLACDPLDASLVSVLLKPFRGVLSGAMLRHGPQVSVVAEGTVPGDQPLRWLRLARALKLQVPQPWLAPCLAQTNDIEVLIAAIRLVQGEQGADAVAQHAQHPQWQVRSQVASALGFIGTLAQVPQLLALVCDAQWWVRYRAAQALLRMPGLPKQQVLAQVQATQDRYALSMVQAVLAEEGRVA
jgi:hypothetical protein